MITRTIRVAIVVGLLPSVSALHAQEPSGGKNATRRAEDRLQAMLRFGAGFDSFTSGPVRLPSPPALERVTLPLSLYRGLPPRPELPAGKVPLPHPLPELPPLVGYDAPPRAPRRVEFATMPLLALPAIDVREPLPLPILAQPQRDRAALGDPTLEISIAAALRPLTPAREHPLPFAPMNLPDPFENVAAGQLPSPPAERSEPPVIPVRTPGH